MFKNYLLAAWRAILREPLFAAINVLGLAVGLACCLLMLLFIRHETGYDTSYHDVDRLYQAVVVDERGQYQQFALPVSLLTDLKSVPGNGVDEVGAYTPAYRSMHFTLATEVFTEDYVAVSGNFFRLLNRPFIAGNAADALSTPDSIVITQSLARTLFGADQVVGKRLTTDGWRGKMLLTIHGVIADFPANSHIQRRLFVNFFANAAMVGAAPDLSELAVSRGLIRMSPNADIAAVTARLDRAYQARPWKLGRGQTRRHVETRAMPAIHLADTALQIVGTDGQVAGSLSNGRLVITATFLAGLVLLIAIVNFINMMIARSGQRRREIATRKALGASRPQLIAQYLLEALVLTVIALVIAVSLVEMLLPGFNTLVDRSLTTAPLFRPDMLLAVFLLVSSVGLLAGIYPAWVLSGLPAVASHAAPAGNSRLSLRQALVFGQFLVTSLLIVIAMTAHRQLELFRNQDPGFDPEVYIAQIEPGSRQNFLNSIGDPYLLTSQWDTVAERIRNELLGQPAIADVSTPMYVPAGVRNTPAEAAVLDVPDAKFVSIGFNNSVDDRFLHVFSLPLLAGRNFSAQRASDRSETKVIMSARDPAQVDRIEMTGGAVLLTASAAEGLGFRTPESALGARVQFNYRRPPSVPGSPDNPVYTVIGVTGNMLMSDSLGGASAGAFLFNDRSALNFVIKAEPGQKMQAAVQARETLKRVVPYLATNVSYLPDTLEQSLKPFGRLMIGFVGYALLAIVISCLGLYAMTAFVIARRTREIGVRKVLGAGNGQLTGLLAWGLIKPVVLALVLALPAGHVLGDYLLQPFTHRVAVGFSILGMTALISLLIAWATVSGQSARLASARPSDLLRYQ